jgi:CheY-like chemotaxis protein
MGVYDFFTGSGNTNKFIFINMEGATYDLLLADDDVDDCILFEDALEELSLACDLNVVNNGVDLMKYLHSTTGKLPDILFLDLNMPLKTGYECLEEIKSSDRLNQLKVIILSTSYNKEDVDTLYENGAYFYIRKPAKYSELREILAKAIRSVSAEEFQPRKDNFVLKIN